jgi:hypothetical protein
VVHVLRRRYHHALMKVTFDLTLINSIFATGRVLTIKVTFDLTLINSYFCHRPRSNNFEEQTSTEEEAKFVRRAANMF